jgi:voltage-gated potassium channel
MIRTFPDAIWWAVTTASTVGSSLEPVTPEGRFIALFLILLGISVVAGLAAALASYFVGHRASAETAELMGKMEALEARLSRVGLEASERSSNPSSE